MPGSTNDDVEAVSDSQLALGDQYAYSQASFVEFYDLMVASLPLEFEVGLDVEVYKTELERLGPGTVAVDLATGSGRVLAGLSTVKSCKTLVGIDNAQAMLDACSRRLCNSGCDSGPEILLFCQSMQNLHLPEVEGRCDAVFVSAGSFHHLTSRAEQMATLRNIKSLLKPDSQTFVGISLLTSEDCLDSEGEHVTKVGRFERRLLSQDIEHSQEPVARGGEAFDSVVVTAAYECTDTHTGAVQRQMWSLRTVSDAEFVALCGACGLKIDAKYVKFADVEKGALAQTTDEPKLYFLSPLAS